MKIEEARQIVASESEVMEARIYSPREQELATEILREGIKRGRGWQLESGYSYSLLECTDFTRPMSPKEIGMWGKTLATAVWNKYPEVVVQSNIIVSESDRGGALIACKAAEVLGKQLVLANWYKEPPPGSVSSKMKAPFLDDIELCLCMFGIEPGDRFMILDELISSASTTDVLASLGAEMGGEAVLACYLVEKNGINGRERLDENGWQFPVESLVKFEVDGEQVRVLN